LALGFLTSVIALALFGHFQIKNGVSMKMVRSFEKRWRNGRKRRWPGANKN